ncbi:hypothetical protein C8Q78DRAFT_627337 [Trametes maxima]|nr:hypothetical protein C8Q78DRAFT_627337 [Trametes maxima]
MDGARGRQGHAIVEKKRDGEMWATHTSPPDHRSTLGAREIPIEIVHGPAREKTYAAFREPPGISFQRWGVHSSLQRLHRRVQAKVPPRKFWRAEDAAADPILCRARPAPRPTMTSSAAASPRFARFVIFRPTGASKNACRTPRAVFGRPEALGGAGRPTPGPPSGAGVALRTSNHPAPCITNPTQPGSSYMVELRGQKGVARCLGRVALSSHHQQTRPTNS